jgi:hypothetical protein
MEKEVIPLPAENRVLPGKATDDTLLHPIPIHGPKKVFQARQASLFIFIDDPEPFIPATEKRTVFLNFFREKMRMDIDDHGLSCDQETCSLPGICAG